MPLQIIRQDITKIKCDVIVCPTDRWLSGSGGADRAIHLAAGPAMDEHCQSIGSLSVGEAVIMPAYAMENCKQVIHVAGPLWRGGLNGERVLLKSCYFEALKLAVANECDSIAFPLIASGTYGFPKEKVLKIAVEVISDFLNDYELDVSMIVYDKTSYTISQKLQQDIEEYIDNNYLDENISYKFIDSSETKYGNEKESEVPKSYFDSIKNLFSRHSKSREDKYYRDDDDIFCDEDDDFDYIPTGNYAPQAPTEKLDEFESLSDLLEKMDKGFSDTLFYYIDLKGISDVDAYKRSNVSRKTFSKIKCDSNYKPSKITAVSFAIGLRLNLDETTHLLATTGICLSRANKFDVIIDYFIRTGNYKSIHDVNEVLYQYDQVLLGC